MNPEHLKSIRRIVTHAYCPDGLASAMILKSALPSAEVEYCQYEQLEALDASIPTIFCDIAPYGEKQDGRLTVRGHEQVLAHVAAGSIVLDHHATGREQTALFGERGRYADNRGADVGITGALLAYEEVYVILDSAYGPVLDFARLAGVRDTWQTDSPRWEEACAQAEALMFYGAARLEDRARRHGICPGLSTDQMDTGRILRATKLEQAEATARGLYITAAGPYRVGLFNDAAHGFRWTSDVAEAARRLGIEIDLLAGYYYRVEPDGELRLHYSMRSIAPEIYVQKIGEAYGGGGHPKAAGFSLPTGLRMQIGNRLPRSDLDTAGGIDPVRTFERAITAAKAGRRG